MAVQPRHNIGHSTWTVLHSFPYSIVRNDDRGNTKDYLAKYLLLVDAVFDLYPCHMCWMDIQQFRVKEHDSLINSLEGLTDSKQIIHKLVMWAFRLHNFVTRKLHWYDSGVHNKTDHIYLILEESLDKNIIEEEEILSHLDKLYNIVYD